MKDKLLQAIACPKCQGQLQYDADKKELICPKDQLIYAIKDGIPALLENEAKAITN